MVPELIWLAAGTAGILLTIDVVYWRNGRLATVYLLDAAMEAVFFAGAMVALTRKSPQVH